MLIGYARVSKLDQQDTRAQAKELKRAGCKRIFEESASSGRWDRPKLHRALDQLREGDVLIVWKLDRLSRSLKDLLHILEKITDAKAGFRSLTEAIDTTTPAGRMMLQMLGALQNSKEVWCENVPDSVCWQHGSGGEWVGAYPSSLHIRGRRSSKW
jgi:DNA invertase Pin-like site-specific DNA recombinase